MTVPGDLWKMVGIDERGFIATSERPAIAYRTTVASLSEDAI
jgi:hypothetical protein